MKMTPEQWLGVVRTVLSFVGGLLVTQGVVDATLETSIIGSVMTLVTAIWSIAAKKVINGVHQGDPVVKMFQKKAP